MTKQHATKMMATALGIAYACGIAAWFLVSPANGVMLAVVSTIWMAVLYPALRD